MINAKKIYTNGFTLIEVVIVVVIVGILATIVGISYSGIQASARDKSILSDLDSLDGLQTSYGLKNNVAGKAWYSGSGIDSDLAFTPSSGNIIDVVVNSNDYCMRGYNPSSANYKTLGTAAVKESSPGSCSVLIASYVAGGSGTGIIGWWNFNGNANDLSGNGYNGSVSGALLVNGQNGTSNGAYSFDGNTSKIVLPALGTFSTFSVSFWLKTSQTTAGRVLAIGNWGSGDNADFDITNDSNKIRIEMWDGSRYISGDSLSSINNGVWHHVLVTRNGATVLIYIDGALDVTLSSMNSANIISASTGTRFGSHPADIKLLNGVVDDARIYNRVLPGSEVFELYNAGAQ